MAVDQDGPRRDTRVPGDEPTAGWRAQRIQVPGARPAASQWPLLPERQTAECPFSHLCLLCCLGLGWSGGVEEEKLPCRLPKRLDLSTPPARDHTHTHHTTTTTAPPPPSPAPINQACRHLMGIWIRNREPFGPSSRAKSQYPCCIARASQLASQRASESKNVWSRDNRQLHN